MDISDDLIRQLAARREGRTLDFKEKFVENSPEGSAELAKDIMAIANSLKDGERGYLLFGVAEDPTDHTGVIRGFEPKDWITDSNLQQKVRPALNRLPSFSWSLVTVDACVVGVIEIRSGGRPFFPLKDAKSYKRFVAPHRVGSSTDAASPDEIVEWSREDDSRRAKELEHERAEQDVVVIPRLVNGTGTRSGGKRTQELQVRNDGNAIFSVSAARCSWLLREPTWREGLHQDLAKHLSDMPPFVQTLRVPVGTVKAGEYAEIKIDANLQNLRAHFDRYLANLADYAQIELVDWIVGMVEVECQGISKGRTGRAETIFKW